ncbi:MAG: LytTR family transcriptional regulator DNA-binding domain-containing protein [Bacteroidota bacterium]
MKQLLKKQRKVITFLIWTLWIPIILFCAHLLIAMRSNSIFPFLILSIVLFFILIVIGKISNELEKESNYAGRIFKQFLYGFLMPSFSLIIIIVLYDIFINDDTVQSIHLLKELLIIAAYLYFVNSFYLVVHIGQKFSIQLLPIEEEKCYHDKVVVYHQGAYGPINLMEIALIDQRHQINWLVTFKEEEHILNLSLNAINDILGVKQFFKINRSQIVHKEAIGKFKAGSFGKIELALNVNAINATVSKDRAKEFRKWFYR